MFHNYIVATLVFNPTLNCGTIKSQSKQTFEISIKALKSVSNATVVFLINGIGANGFHPTPVKISFETRALLLPKFALVDYGITSNRGDNIIRAGEISDIKVRIQNRGEGIGKNPSMSIRLPQNVFFSSTSKQSFEYKELYSGDYVDIDFTIVPNREVAKEIELTINVTDENTKLTLPLKLSIDKPLQTIQELVVKGIDKKADIKDIAGLRSEIEIDIPRTNIVNKNAVALVIGISNYQNTRIPTVKFANRDAALIRQYLEKTLGYDPKNILPQNTDEVFTAATLKTYIKNRLASYLKPDGSSELFIYFTGHGAPSIMQKEAYLVPFDGDPNFVNDINAYNMKEFYQDILKLTAKKKIVVIDACFSGQAGDGTMLINNASPIYITVENPLTVDNSSILFLSSESNQVSNWYPEKRHSMFTYFFLKGLKGDADKNKDGIITVGELSDFINDENDGLPYHSNREFQRPQRAVIIGDQNSSIIPGSRQVK